MAGLSRQNARHSAPGESVIVRGLIFIGSSTVKAPAAPSARGMTGRSLKACHALISCEILLGVLCIRSIPHGMLLRSGA